MNIDPQAVLDRVKELRSMESDRETILNSLEDLALSYKITDTTTEQTGSDTSAWAHVCGYPEW